MNKVHSTKIYAQVFPNLLPSLSEYSSMHHIRYYKHIKSNRQFLCFQKFFKLSWEITNKHTSHQGKKRPSLLQGGLKSQRFPFKCQEFMKTIWYVIWMHCFILRYILFNNRKIMQIEDKYWSFCLRINYLSSNEQVLFSNHQLYS